MTDKNKAWLTTVIGISAFFVGVSVGYALHKSRSAKKSRVVERIVKAEEPEDNQPELPFEPEEKSKILTFESPKVIRVDGTDYQVEEIEIVPNDEPDDPGDYLVNPRRNVEWDQWSQTEENERRLLNPERPYVISYDEYRANEYDFPQTSIMYYEGDDVLCDELDVPIYGRDKIVGMLLFGHGSGDPNIVFVRNEKIEAEYEILRQPGHFGIDVLGLEEEPIEHSSPKKNKPKKEKEPIRKFRSDD